MTPEKEIKDWLQLYLSENIGPMTFMTLASYYGSAGEALKHINDFARRGGRKKPIQLATPQAAEKQMQHAQETGTHILLSKNNDYPKRLKEIDGAPPVLFVRGNPALLQKKAVAIVGTRNASLNGKKLTQKLANDLSLAGITVISGMARGIDTAAHIGALQTDGKGGTIAVLGTAVDQIYPAENKELYHTLLQKGCLISEFPFFMPLSPTNFPRRNRIISGLSQGVLVVEAQTRSGSLITAREALDQGRDVFAVPGSPADPRSQGPNHLLKQGAVLVEDYRDILAVLDTTEFNLFEKHTPVDYTPKNPVTDAELDRVRTIVLDNLNTTPVNIDELIRETGLNPASVNIILAELELCGKLQRHRGHGVSLIV
ncbi:MAG: DNA-processing protein DprA [Lactobacillales bacterium]|jgi:DNA processing protein|nr:DNA-processing protein DprA [Lactobacillales bacterium]